MEHGHFAYEKLDAWRVAREALRIGLGERGSWKRLPGDLADQLERALLSTVANIAEGAGRESKADQKRHYAIARASANEAGALIDLVNLCGGLSVEGHEAMRSRLIRVVQMLNAMIRR
jgi:four helix bundle protein